MAPKRFIRGMTRHEGGNVLLITAAFLLVLVLSFAALTEYGRYFILREKTQTAADAAALAAGLAGTTRWVEFNVDVDQGTWWKSEPYPCDSYDCNCTTDKDGNTICDTCYHTCYTHESFHASSVQFSGFHDREKDASSQVSSFQYKPLEDLKKDIESNTCKSYGSRYSPVSPNPCYDSGLKVIGPLIVDRWVEYSGKDQTQAATSYFLANLPGLARGGAVTDVSVHRVPTEWKNDPNTGVSYPDPDKLREDPYYPSVIVKVKTYIEKLWDQFRNYIGPSKTNVCAQSSTHYANPKTGKWSRPPDEACVPQ